MDDNKGKASKTSSITKIMIIAFISIIIVYIGAKYATDPDFRYNINSNILKKEIIEDDITSILIDNEQSPYIYAYDKYIVLLSKNTLTIYNQDGNIANTLTISVATPLFVSNGKYLLIADRDGQNLYIISGTNIAWQKEINGNIYQASINQNGYVSLIIKNTIYKSVVTYYDNNGIELFNTYLYNSYATCSDISTNNSYLAIGEVDYSGTIIKSIVKIISVDLAKTDSENSIVYQYNSNKGSILTNINYIDKTHAICSFNDYIANVSPDSAKIVYEISNDDLFIDINILNSLIVISKQSSGLFSYEYEVLFKKYNSTKENLYILASDLPESLLTTNKILAINLGNEIQFVSDTGYLKKRYASNTQITNIVLGDTVAGIIYKNKIDIIKF